MDGNDLRAVNVLVTVNPTRTSTKKNPNCRRLTDDSIEYFLNRADISDCSSLGICIFSSSSSTFWSRFRFSKIEYGMFWSAEGSKAWNRSSLFVFSDCSEEIAILIVVDRLANALPVAVIGDISIGGLTTNQHVGSTSAK